ncbi:DUF4880 domain-containing protein [Alcaligenes sp. NLF5-7]|uniref:FecR family protein n=1 Tax=Alcaligenes sp. NLF5-7 TaxID=2918755 RepID=UPI0020C2C173|nr:FecR domain-containing protein [Alcaligenes sp. NLF5-7]UTM01073.1 DUF4880 domain-containing protein [Alcaligenes sp. NLF5-7]
MSTAHPTSGSVSGASTMDASALRQQAHDWAIKLKTGAPTTDDVAAFHAWRNQSQAHALAWSQACEDWKTLGQAAQQYEQRYPQKVRRPQRVRQGRRMFFGAAASAFGALAVVSIVRPPLGLWPSWSELQADYRTGTGEQRELALSENVQVSLNTQTAIMVQPSANLPTVSLIAGEAAIASRGGSCEVVADVGRLVVSSGDFEVRRLEGGQVRVRCLEGRGELHHPIRTVALTSREEVTYDRHHLGERIQMVAAASNWRQGMVEFDDLPLARVIEEINRYRPGRVVLMNDALAQRRFSAKFQIQALDDAIALMEDVLGVRVRRAGDLVILT